MAWTYNLPSLVQLPKKLGNFPDIFFPSILLQISEFKRVKQKHIYQNPKWLIKPYVVCVILTSLLDSSNCYNSLVLSLINRLQKEVCKFK